MESMASSPRGIRGGFHRGKHTQWDDDRSVSPMQVQRSRSRHLTVEVVPMGPPPPPQPSSSHGLQGPSTTRAPPDFSFLEKLHAVEEELAIGPVCLEPYQPPMADGLMACRTRSKRPLRDVPMGQLEAELCAPDITPDMYGCGSAPEDLEWTHWLQGIMTSDMYNDEEGDDDDDPEYNFLAEIDEPDVEDYRNDRAVRIPKKEVNQLMEELFETVRDSVLCCFVSLFLYPCVSVVWLSMCLCCLCGCLGLCCLCGCLCVVYLSLSVCSSSRMSSLLRSKMRKDTRKRRRGRKRRLPWGSPPSVPHQISR
uniref:Uncharacterized protein n=1 Tax=Oncorhynchus kisutch TaxID=8019 RepID=A0A8C7IYT7_ONCKI